jgi:serine/threonine-protein kinase HipA
LLCVRAYGDEALALYIGDEDRFDAVGSHSWEALCADCGFGFAPLMVEFRRMAQAFVPAWTKVRERVAGEPGVTPDEQRLLSRMTQVFEQHAAHALSMTSPRAQS